METIRPATSELAFLTAAELAEMLRVSPSTVLRLAREGRLPCARLGHRTVRFVLADVRAAMRRGEAWSS